MADLTLLEEQEAFDRQLNELLKKHEGKFVLFKGGRVVAIFDNHESAYRAGLDQFGPDVPFLIAPIVKGVPEPVSIAWDAGVMFG